MATQTTQERYRFETLSEQHDVAQFNSDNSYLNFFLQEKALNETKRDLSRTFVLLDPAISSSAVAGYITLRADSYYLHSENYIGQHIIPVAELVCLARHIQYRGQGIGDYLLLEAFHIVNTASALLGIAGMQLSYTAEGKRLYDRYGFAPHPYGESLLFISMNDIRQILADASRI